MKTQNKNIILIVLGVIIVAALSRLLPHPFNFTPIGAMALFGVSHLKNKALALSLPLLSLFFSDLIINNTIYASEAGGFQFFGSIWVYIGFLLIGLMGMFTLKRVKPLSVLLSSIGASVIFFLVTNFGVWAGYSMYSSDFSGLLASYTAGLPFFWNTLAGDLFYCTIMFGSYYLLSKEIKGLSAVYSRT